MARSVSHLSKDPSTKVGAIIIEGDSVRSVGYNSFPKGIPATDERLNDREQRLRLTVHAELDAIIGARMALEDSEMFLWGFRGPPCRGCALHIIHAGIRRVTVGGKPIPERWASSMQDAQEILEEAGVALRVVA